MKTILISCLLLLSSFVHAQNLPPVTTPDSFFVYSESTKNISLSFLKLNDSDPNGDILIVDTINPPQNGYFDFINASIYRYNPNPGFYGVDSIEYIVCDNGSPQLCSTGKIYMRVYQYHANYAYDALNPNNLRGGIVANGNLFYNGGNNWDIMLAAPYLPEQDSSNRYTVFSGSFWVGGINSDNGNKHVAATMYNSNGFDFRPGPIRDTSLYDFDDPNYKWNRVWKVSEAEILQHMSNYTSPTYSIPEVILKWPGNGNVSEGEAAQLAPFYDKDNDGKYEPLSGDYPKIKGDEAVYSIFNDEFWHTESGSYSLKIEVHSLAYGFKCDESESLNNTIFIDYNIINRSDNTYDSTYIGFFSDMDLGNPQDDYVGCDVNRSLFYTYNGDLFDENAGGAFGFGDKIPVQALAILSGSLQDEDGIDNALGISNGESINGLGYGDGVVDNEHIGMSNFIYYNMAGLGPGCCVDPSNGTQFYNYMKSTWLDNSQMIFGGYGHTNSQPNEVKARYMYPGDSDPYFFGTDGIDPQYSLSGGWNEANTGNSPYDRRGLSSTGPFTFKPGDEQEITIAYIFARDTSDNYNPKGVLDNYADELKAMFVADSTPCKQGAFSSVEKVKERKENIMLYPNPANNLLHISSSEYILSYSIFDVYGKLICNKKPLLGRSIDVQNLSEGIYLIQLNTIESSTTMKFVKR